MDIKVLKAQGYSQRAVARRLGVHRDTVRRVWDESEPRKYRRGPRASKLDGFKEQLLSRLGSHPGLCATRLYREIRSTEKKMQKFRSQTARHGRTTPKSLAEEIWESFDEKPAVVPSSMTRS